MSKLNLLVTLIFLIILVLQEAYLLGIMVILVGILIELDDFNEQSKGTESGGE